MRPGTEVSMKQAPAVGIRHTESLNV